MINFYIYSASKQKALLSQKISLAVEINKSYSDYFKSICNFDKKINYKFLISNKFQKLLNNFF